MWLVVLTLIVLWEAGLVAGLRFGGGIHLLLLVAAGVVMLDAHRSRRRAGTLSRSVSAQGMV